MPDAGQGPVDTAASVEWLDLGELYIHDLNPRKATTETENGAIRLLAESIHAGAPDGKHIRPLQNLAGYRDPDIEGVGIVAGGRRLRALELLAEDGHHVGPIPVQVTEDPFQAEGWANAENTARADLDPADEVRAYARMHSRGAPAPSIAKAFGVTEVHVARRLALAGLPDEVIDALKAKEISLGQAAAFTVSQDQARILEMLEHVRDRDYHPNAIRRRLREQDISGHDRRARYVGLEAYELAGGTVTRDLFGDDVWLSDESLLDRCFAEKLNDEAAQVEEEGWAFVWHTAQPSLDDEKRMKTVIETSPDPVELPEADEAELEELLAISHLDITEEQDQRIDELQERRLGSFTDDQRAELGVMIWVDYSGDARRIEGLKPKDDAKLDSADQVEQSGETTSAEAPAVSAALAQDLGRVRLVALQTAMLSKTELLLDLLAYAIRPEASHDRPLGIRMEPPQITPDVADALLLDKRLTPEDSHNWRAPDVDELQAMQAEGKKHRNAILSTALARVVTPGAGPFRDWLEETVGANIRAIWTPTAANYFGRLRKREALDRIFDEVLQLDEEDPARVAFQGLKKSEAAKELEALFSDASTQEVYGLSREQIARIDAWVPAEIRRKDD